MKSTNKLSLSTNITYIGSLKGKNNQSFSEQLNNTGIEQNKLHTIENYIKLYTIYENTKIHIIFNESTKQLVTIPHTTLKPNIIEKL